MFAVTSATLISGETDGAALTVEQCVRTLATHEPSSTHHWTVTEWSDGCFDALLYLSAVEQDVTPEMRALIDSENDVRVQYRGIKVLMKRGNELGLLETMRWLRATDPSQRAAAWHMLLDWPERGRLLDEITPETLVELYESETDELVRRTAEAFFGRLRVDFAVDALCRTLTNLRWRDRWYSPIHALGDIGDRRAVPALVASSTFLSDRVRALGKIGDRAGQAFVVEHLYVPGAPLALGRLGAVDAIPLLEQRLEVVARGLDRWGNPLSAEYVSEHAFEVRMALMLLKSDDAHGQLIELAEDATLSLAHRRMALWELQRLGSAPVRVRLLKLYDSVMPTMLGIDCALMMANADDDDATEAMTRHLLLLKSGAADDAGILSLRDRYLTIQALTSLLHRRIGNQVFTLRHKR